MSGGPVQHTTSLLAFLHTLQGSEGFTDLTIICQDGMVSSYRLLVAACSQMVAGCMLGPEQEEGATILLAPVLVEVVDAGQNSAIALAGR